MTFRKLQEAFKQFLLSLFIVPLTVTMIASPAINLNPLATEDAFLIVLLGLAITGIGYLAGHVNSTVLLKSPDGQLISFTPLTPARLLWQNLKRTLFLLIVLFPILPTLGAIGRFTAQGVYAEPLFGFNTALALLALFLYPLLMASAPRLRPLDCFFFLRRLIPLPLAFYRKIAYRLPSLRRIQPYEGIIAFVVIVATARFFANPILAFFLEWNRAGAPARFLTFLCVPFCGIYYVHSAEAAAWEGRALTIFLAGLNLACLYGYSRLYRIKPEERERERFEGWLAIRDQVEAGEAVWYVNATAGARSATARRTAMAAREAHETRPHVEPALELEFEGDDFDPPPEALPYETPLDPWDQHARHLRHWLGASAEQDLSRRDLGFILYLSGSVVLALAVSETARHIGLAAAALIYIAAPFVFAFRCGWHIRSIRACSHFAPLDWRPLSRKIAAAKSRKQFAFEIAIAGWFSFALGAGVWGWFPVWIMFGLMRWCVAGAIRIDASCSARTNTPSKFIGILLAATVVIGFLTLMALVATAADANEPDGGAGIALGILFVDAMYLHVFAWEFAVHFLIRRRFGTQIVMDPRHEPSPS